jgi:hypothetical protein
MATYASRTPRGYRYQHSVMPRLRNRDETHQDRLTRKTAHRARYMQRMMATRERDYKHE